MRVLLPLIAVLLNFQLAGARSPALAQERETGENVGILGVGVSVPATLLAGQRDVVYPAVFASVLGAGSAGKSPIKPGFRLDVGIGGLSDVLSMSVNIGPVLAWAPRITGQATRPLFTLGMEYAFTGDRNGCDDCAAADGEEVGTRMTLHGLTGSVGIGFLVDRLGVEFRYAPTFWFASRNVDRDLATPHRVMLTVGLAL